jgi:hypothetical protein
MIIVIPASSEDAVSEKGLEALIKFGPYQNHEALVVAKPSDEARLKVVFDKVQNLFSKVSTHVFSQDGPSAPPSDINFCWFHSAHYLKYVANSVAPWFWFGAQATPLKSGWLDSLESEYNLAKMPFLGAFVDTELVSADGTTYKEGQHLARSAVYSQEYLPNSSLASHSPLFPINYEVFCQNEIVPRAHNTSLIQVAGDVKSSSVLYHGHLKEAAPEPSESSGKPSGKPSGKRSGKTEDKLEKAALE